MASRKSRGAEFSGLWFIGFLGALAYYLHTHSGTFWLVLVALFKSIFWLAFLVYHLLAIPT